MQGRRTSTGSGIARWLAAAGFLALSALAFPALAQTEGVGSGSTAREVELDEVDAYRLALLKMKGHLGIALALTRQDAPGAAYHMDERMQAIYESHKAAFQEWNAPVTEDILRELANAAERAPATALPAIESAVHAVNGSFAQTGSIDKESVLSLVEALLRAAVQNYGEAVENNEVADVQKYQTGRGLVTQAEALVRHSTALEDKPGQEALLDLVTLIRQAWPGLMPPPIVFDPESVADRLEEAVATIEGMR